MASPNFHEVSYHLLHLVAFTAILGLFAFTYRVLRNPISKLPGPWYSKWTDVVLKYYWLRGRRSFYVHDLHKKYGPLVRVGPEEVDVTDLSAVKEIHSFKGGYLKSPWYRMLTIATNMNVFNTTDIEFHRRHRRLLSGPMSESSLKSMEPYVRERANLTMERIREEMIARGAADVFKWSLFYATDVIGELTFGESFRMLEIGKENQYVIYLRNVAKLGGLRSTFPGLVKLSNIVPLPRFKQAAEAAKHGLNYAVQSVQRHQHLVTVDPVNLRPTLFTKLYKAGEEGLSEEEIVTEAQAYIIAGSDTTAITLAYLFWSVCRRPDIRRALVKELETLPDDFADRHLKELSYLNQVINETLRLYSAAPSGLPRIVPPGGAELGGCWLPGGSTVTTQAFSLHRDPEVFPRPGLFDPSRWATPTKEMKDLFMPFGGGSRRMLTK